MTTTTEFTGQKFATETLVTDTVAYDIVDASASGKTIIVRRRASGDTVRTAEGGMVVYRTTVPAEHLLPFRLRVRKDGTFRTHRSGHPFRFTDETPVTRVDYAF